MHKRRFFGTLSSIIQHPFRCVPQTRCVRSTPDLEGGSESGQTSAEPGMVVAVTIGRERCNSLEPQGYIR